MPDQTLGELKAYLRVDTTSLDVATAKAKAFGDGMASSFAKVGVAGAAIGLGAAGVAVDMAAKFQQQMTLIRTQAGDTTDNLDVLGKQILGLAGSVGFSPDSLAQAFYHMASAGITGAAGLDAVKMAAQLAAVGQSDLEATTQAVLFTLKAGLPDIHNATDAVGMLNAIVGQGDMRMNQLTESLSSGILPVAAQFGVSMRSLGAALTFMSDRGVPPAEATTRLRMSLALMAAPTKQATKLLTDAGLGFTQASYQVNAMTKALHDSGVSTTQLAEDLKKPDGIMVALKDLKDHLTAAGVSADMQNATLSRAFGGGKSGGTIMMLYGQLDAVKQKYDQLGAASKTFADSWATQQGTFDQRVKSLKSSLDSLIITAGNALLPMATQIITFFGDVAATLSGTETATSKTDTAAQSFAGTLKQIGGFIGNDLMPALKTLGSWMLDHKELIAGIGLAFAGWKLGGAANTAVSNVQKFFGAGAATKVIDAAGQRVFVTNWAMIGGGGGLGGALTGGGAPAAAGGGGFLGKIGMGGLLGDMGTVAGILGGAAVAVPTIVGASAAIVAGLGAWAIYAAEGSDEAHRAANGFGLSADAVDALTQALHQGAGARMSPTDAANLLAQTMSEAGASSQTINDALSAAAAPMSNGILNTEQSITYFAQNFGKAGETTYQILQEFQGLNAAQIAAFPQTIAAFTNVTEHMGKVDLSTSALDKAFAGVAGLPPGGVLQDFTNLQKSIHNATDAANALSGKFGVGNSTNLGGGPGNTGSASPSKSVTIHIQPGATLKPADLSNALGWVLTHG